MRAVTLAPSTLTLTLGINGPNFCLTGDSPHGSAELLVRHIRVLFAHAPHARDFLGPDDPEDALASVLPANQRRVSLGVEQQVPDELPQVQHPVRYNIQIRK